MSKQKSAWDNKVTYVCMIILSFVIGVTISQIIVSDKDYGFYAHGSEMTKEDQAKNKKHVAELLEQMRATKNTQKYTIEMDRYKLITVELSQICINQIKANITTNCPTYADLEKFDTTDKVYFGKFKFDHGYYHRVADKRTFKNPEITLKSGDPYVVCVDCPARVFTKSKNIVIVGQDFIYKNNADKHITNATRYVYQNHIGCYDAVIPFNLLNETINYMSNGCKDLKYIEKITIKMNQTKHDIKTSQAYKNKVWMHDAKDIAKKLAEEYCKKEGSKCREKT